ncbi:cation:proton antiporter, partial [Candidatus Woesearchaeota archaeon]|nr:cation:proton antiporter [Candidatus Woesearchaeota archaeon]
MENLFLEVSVIILLAVASAVILRFFKQPPLFGYILAGLIIGPIGLGFIKNPEVINLFSLMGMVFLLFFVGLQMDYRKLKILDKSSLVISFSQMIITGLLAYGLSRAWFSHTESLFLAIAVSFSSTVIVIKLLSDKNELQTLHGRLVLNILLLQDLAAVFVLLFVANLSNIESFWSLAGISLLKLLLLLIIIILCSLFILPPLFRYLAKSTELLFLSAMAWLFVVAQLFNYLNYSEAIGGFVAGVTLAATPFAVEISSRSRSLRDFFVTIFFVSLGMRIVPLPSRFIFPAIILFLAVVLFKPIITAAAMRIFNHNRRVSFAASFSLGQISEFSLVLIVLGQSLGYVSSEVVSFLSILTLATMAASVYFIEYPQFFYHHFNFLLFFLRRSEPLNKKYRELASKTEVVLCGHNRIGYSVLKGLHQLNKKVLVVDYDPEVIAKMEAAGIPALYGDVGDAEVIERMDLKNKKMLISTVPDKQDNILLL